MALQAELLRTGKRPPKDSYIYVYQMGNSKKRQKVMVKYRFVGFCFI